jgi:hypothetical protein
MRIPQQRRLVVTVPKEHNYKIPEGRYVAKIHKVTRVPRPGCPDCGELLRIMFVLQVAGKEQFTNLAKAEIPLNLEHGSDLRRVLGRLLGRDQLSALSGGEVDLSSLVGRTADVEVEHIRTSHSDEYDFPFVLVTDIQSAGTWVNVESKDDAQ